MGKVTVGKADGFAMLQGPDRECDLAFRMDVMGHLNDLNLKLQGKNMFLHEPYSYIRASVQSQADPVFLTNDQQVLHAFPNATMDVPHHHANR